MATSVLKAATSTPNIPVAATISEVDRAVLERMSKGSPENLDLGSSAESLRLKKILHGRPPSSSTSFSSDSDESNDSSAKSRDLRREAMKEVLRKKKEEIRRENEKLNSSLTTALCKSEEAVLTNKKWMEEIKDLNSSFEKLPAISKTKKVAGTGQAWVV